MVRPRRATAAIRKPAAILAQATAIARATAIAQAAMVARAGFAARAATIALAVLSAAGCAGADWIETYPDIASRARTDPQAFVAQAHGQWEGLRGMVGSYRVQVRRGAGRRTFDTQVVLLRDTFFSLEVLSPAATTEGMLVAGRSEVGLWWAEEGRLYRGPLSPGAFGRALGIDLEPDDVVAALMGLGVAAREGGRPRAEWDENAQRIRVANAAGATAWLHPVFARFERIRIPTGGRGIEVVIEEWAEEPAPVPLRLVIAVPDDGIELTMRLASNWTPNPDGLGPEYFDVSPIPGSVETPLELLGVDGGLLRRGVER